MKNPTSNARAYKVPTDLAATAFRMFIKNKVKFEIAGVKEKEDTILIEVDFSTSKHGDRVRDGIETVLREYKEFMQDIITDNLILTDNDEDNDE